jgi:hypothetical protein
MLRIKPPIIPANHSPKSIHLFQRYRIKLIPQINGYIKGPSPVDPANIIIAANINSITISGISQYNLRFHRNTKNDATMPICDFIRDTVSGG